MRAYRERLFEIAKPSRYRWPYRRPNELWEPEMAAAWDQTDNWITAPEWLAWLRRSGKPYKVWSRLTRGKWMPRVRPSIRANSRPRATLFCGYLPDGEQRARRGWILPAPDPSPTPEPSHDA